MPPFDMRMHPTPDFQLPDGSLARLGKSSRTDTTNDSTLRDQSGQCVESDTTHEATLGALRGWIGQCIVNDSIPAKTQLVSQAKISTKTTQEL